MLWRTKNTILKLGLVITLTTPDVPSRLDYCRLEATDVVLRPGDGDLYGFLTVLPGRFFYGR